MRKLRYHLNLAYKNISLMILYDTDLESKIIYMSHDLLLYFLEHKQRSSFRALILLILPFYNLLLLYESIYSIDLN